MDAGRTTTAIEHYLLDLAHADGNSAAEVQVRALLARAVERLRFLCLGLLYKSYPRLTRGPLNLEVDDLLSAVVERLIKALRSVRPKSVRAFFALANQHMRWELNDLARRLDEKMLKMEAVDAFVIASESSGSGISVNAQRMLEAIEKLPDDEREVFSLVRIQELTNSEVAELLEVSEKTVQRRLNRGLLLLEARLADLRPDKSSDGVN